MLYYRTVALRCVFLAVSIAQLLIGERRGVSGNSISSLGGVRHENVAFCLPLKTLSGARWRLTFGFVCDPNDRHWSPPKCFALDARKHFSRVQQSTDGNNCHPPLAINTYPTEDQSLTEAATVLTGCTQNSSGLPKKICTRVYALRPTLQVQTVVALLCIQGS